MSILIWLSDTALRSVRDLRYPPLLAMCRCKYGCVSTALVERVDIAVTPCAFEPGLALVRLWRDIRGVN
jgi:hypothetical protein